MLKILKIAKAAKARELRGINSTLEACKSAFATLLEIISKITPVGIMKCLFDRTDFENLTSYFNTSERYIRGNFVYELSAHSPVRTHCVTFALSDSKTKPFSQKCPENDHMEKCSNCQLLPQAIQILRNMIEVLYNNKAITHYDYVEFVYDTVDAHSKIQAYIFHLIRNHQSNNVWKTMMDRQVEGDVFVTFDFAMKFLPRVS